MAKKLLSEAAVRRFAKLANLSPINEMNSLYNEEEEFEVEDPMGDVEAGAELEAPSEIDPELDAEAGEEIEMDADAPADLEFGEEEVAKIRDVLPILQDIADAGTGGEEGEFEEPLEPSLDEPADDFDGDEGELMPPEEDEFLEDELAEALRGINYIPGRKDVVQEVARRVAKRLLSAKRAESQLQEALGTKRKSVRRTPRRRIKK